MSELNCRELVELVTEYLEGTLAPERRYEFEEHVARCHGCANYLAQLQETIRLTGMVSEDDLSAEAQAELLEVFREWRQQKPPS